MQKITPFLWFDKKAEEAINYYVSIFKNSKVVSIKKYPDNLPEGPMKGMEGMVLTAVFELEGQTFMALDGGPFFKFNPSISFTVNCETAAEVDELYGKLLEGGSSLMPLDKYPWSERYGWAQDKFGLSWQLNAGKAPQKIVPSMMFTGDQFGKAEEAINFYASIFPDSKVNMIARYEAEEGDAEGKIKYSSFELFGEQFAAMESSKEHAFAPGGAISFYVECADQAEVDKYWEALAEGGEPKAQQCGWLADKYGFSWQIIPDTLPKLMNDPDPAKSGRVMQAMLQMKKIVVADLEKAAAG